MATKKIRLAQILPNVWATGSEYPLGGAKGGTKAFLLQRGKGRGNALVYASSRIGSYLDHIKELGGVSRQLLSHRDEASPYCNFFEKAPVFCHELEKDAIEARCTVGATFRGKRAKLELGGDDLIAYHTPGRSVGATSYLFRNNHPINKKTDTNTDGESLENHDTSILFTGDTLYATEQGKLAHGPLYLGNKEDMIETFNFYLKLNPTHVICGLSQQENGFVQKFEADEIQKIIESLKK